MRLKIIHQFNIIFFILTLCVFQLSLAQESSVKVEGGGSSQYKVKSKKSDGSGVETEMELKGISYFEPSTVDNQIQQQFQGSLRAKTTGTLFSNTNVTIGAFSEPNSFYYAFPEAYVGYKTGTNSSVIFGRKIESYSMADSFFNMGLVQSYTTQDNLYFIEGGLTGLRGDIDISGVGFTAMLMPIFIPNQGPQIKTEDGKVVTSNRWAPQPPAKFKLGGEEKNINYAIRDYSVMDIISNSGYLFRAYAGGSKERPLISATFAKKPINDIALSRDTYSDIKTLEGYVILTPVVLNHTVQALDLNLDYENLKTSISFLADQPENKTATDLETIQTLSPINMVSLYASLDLSFNFKRKFEIYVGAAAISGGEIKDLDSAKKQSSTAIATSRIRYKKPIRSGLIADMFYIYNQPFTADVNMTYDQELKGSVLSIQIKYNPTKNLKLSMGADIIGVENDLPEADQGSFLDQNKANDRIFGGVGYVF